MYATVVPETGISNYVGTLDQVWQNIPTCLAGDELGYHGMLGDQEWGLPNLRHRLWLTLIALKR